MDAYDESLVTDNLNIAYKLAWKYYNKFNRVYELEELKSICLLGLVIAAKTFDKNKGFAFSTYAYKVIQNNLLLFNRSNSKTINDLSMFQELGDDFYIVDTLVSGDDVYSDIDNIILNEKLKEYISTFNEREKYIITSILEGKTQSEIAKPLNISQSAVNKMYKRCINKLRFRFFRDFKDY